MSNVRPTAAAPEPSEGAPTANIIVAGAAGRMGSRIVALHREAGLRLAPALEAPGHRPPGRGAGEAAGAGVLGVAISGGPGSGHTPRTLLQGRVLSAARRT